MTQFYIRQQREPCFILLIDDELAKGGPYIGPRGGKWADAKHTIAWDPKKQGKAKQQQLVLFAKPSEPKPEKPASEVKAEAEHQAKVDAYDDKQDAKKERFRIKAENLRTEAKSRFKAGDLREEVSGIPMGQPILVGHHSEKRHRRAIERANANIGKGIEAQKKAEHYEQKAKGVGKAGISSDDPAAVVKLKKQIADEQEYNADMKTLNRLYKKAGGGKDGAGFAEILVAQKFPPEKAKILARAAVVNFNHWPGGTAKPFPNIKSDNIRRMQKRIDILREAEATPEAAPVIGKGYRIEESKEDNRIRFYFDKKPSKDVTKKMKSAGFRWSPTAGAWQRHLNNAGRYATEQMAKDIFQKDEPESKSPVASEPQEKPSGYRYIDGDKAEYTGTTKMLHGKMAYEVEYVEGHKEGTTRYTYKGPNIKKSERFVFVDPLQKAGPYIGPRGGKWQDPQHKIPWKEGAPKVAVKKQEPGKKTRRNWMNHMPGMPKQTVDKWKNADGSYKIERRKLHQKIVNSFIGTKKPPPKDTKKIAIVMMGGPASGKTTLVKRFTGERFNDFVNVNPDDIKEQMPEYNQALNFKTDGGEASAKDAAFMVHEESSNISAQVMGQAISKGLNLVVDGTGKDAKKHTDQIQKLRNAGYHVQLLMPDVDMEEAVKRSSDRAEKTGRYVPAGPPPPGTPDIIRSAHKKIPNNFEKIARIADEFALYDSRSWSPDVKWTGGRGLEDVIHDAIFVEAFKKRASALGVQPMAKADEAEPLSGSKRPYLTVADITKRIKEAPRAVGHEDEKLPKKFDRNTGVVQVVEDIDYSDLTPIKYK